MSSESENDGRKVMLRANYRHLGTLADLRLPELIPDLDRCNLLSPKCPQRGQTGNMDDEQRYNAGIVINTSEIIVRFVFAIFVFLGYVTFF